MLIHLVSRFDDFRVCFVCSLTDDQVDEFVNHAYVRLFCVALQETSQSLLATRGANDRVAGGVSWRIEVASQSRQAGGVLEVGQLNLSGPLSGGLIGLAETYGTVTGNGDRLRILRNCNLGFKMISI